jgi:carbon-monoxide dehydrogenase medium subunit
MVMRNFHYLAPSSVAEASAMLAEHPGEAKLLAGGQSLLLPMRQRLFSPAYLVDLTAVPGLDYIRADGEGGLRIGTLATHTQVLLSQAVRARFPVLAEAEAEVACVQIRNWGTLGGNLCNAEPASDPPPALLALGASVQATGPSGSRTIPLDDFFKGYFETALGPEEVATEIHIPSPPPRCGMSYKRFSIRAAMDHPIVVVAAVVALADDDRCADVRIGMGGAAEVPLRAKEAEAVLRGQRINVDSISEAAEAARREARPIGDHFASKDYKRAMVAYHAREALKSALDHAKAESARR